MPLSSVWFNDSGAPSSVKAWASSVDGASDPAGGAVSASRLSTLRERLSRSLAPSCWAGLLVEDFAGVFGPAFPLALVPGGGITVVMLEDDCGPAGVIAVADVVLGTAGAAGCAGVG